MPLSTTNYNEGDSQFQDDEAESILEDESEEQTPDKPVKAKHRFKDGDPEVQNAKLLQMYAEMQGMKPSEELLTTIQVRDRASRDDPRHAAPHEMDEMDMDEDDIIELDSQQYQELYGFDEEQMLYMQQRTKEK